MRELYYGKEKFPFQDPPAPKCYIASLASGSAVHSDNPFDEIRVPVRGTIAIDMEGATFYRTVTEFPDVRALLVKGVCDYADTDKDGSYHEYASAVSAIYMACFIKDYVTDDLMPRPGRQLPASRASSIDQPPPASDLRRGQPIDFPAEAHTSVQSLRRGDMPSIPSKMYIRLRQTLAACGPFKDNNQLQAVFNHELLVPWYYQVPQATSVMDRVDAIIDFLSKKRRIETHTSALVLFVEVLRDRTDPHDACYASLTRLAEELTAALILLPR